MKKTGLLLLIILAFPIIAAGQDAGRGESIFIQWQKSLEDNKIPGVPALFFKKVNSHWIGFGFLLNSPESFEPDSPFRDLMREFPLFQAALLLQDAKLSSSIVFSYEKNKTWGLSARFSFL